MRSTHISAEDKARRIRAAIGYSGKDIQEVAEAMGIKVPTFRRRASKSTPDGKSGLEELQAIAVYCGVPPAFMEEGFLRYEEAGGWEERLAQVEEATREQMRLLNGLDLRMRTAVYDLTETREILARLADVIGAEFGDELGDDALSVIEQTRRLGAPEDHREEEQG